MEKLINQNYLYRGRILNLRFDTVRVSNGAEAKREIVEHPGAVVIVALDEADNVLLVKQYRHAIGRELLELPAGTLEPAELHAQAAPRELAEETGYTAQRWDLLARFYSSPGILTEEMYVYLARDLVAGTSHPDHDEELSIEKIPLQAALDMITRGEISDAKTLVGLLLVEQKLRTMTA